MNKYKGISRSVVLLVFFLSIASMYSQSWMKPVKPIQFSLPKLIVSDSIFLWGIDSLVLQSNCPTLKSYKQKGFFSLALEMNKHQEGLPLLSVEYSFRALNFPRGGIGYFIFKGYLFVVFGINPNNLFISTITQRKFVYKQSIGAPVATTDDNPEWIFSYQKGQLMLLKYCCPKSSGVR